jgi:O-antigen/teichoic acid export membrane protein
MIIVIILAPILSNVYGYSALKNLMFIFSVSIPFSAIIAIIGSIYQGFERAYQTAFFKNVLTNVFRITFYVIIISAGFGLMGIAYSYVIALVISGLAFILYFIRDIRNYIKWNWNGTSEYKTLLIFSMPMFIASILWTIAAQINLLIFGYFRSAADVGIYSTSILLQTILLFILEAVGFLYLPVYTSLLSRNRKYEMHRTYQVMTKWMIFTTMPIAAFFIMFPSRILVILFGSDYGTGGSALVLITFGTMILLIGALVGSSLIAIGKTKTYMLISSVSALIGIVMGFAFIPIYGIIGIAATTTINYGLGTIIYLVIFYRINHSHPITKALFIPLILFILITSLFWILFLKMDIQFSIIALIIILILFYGMAIVSILMGGGFEKSDIDILIKMEQRFNLHLGWLMNLMNRFSHEK